ncbi:MAG: MBL fold metallo-hydrolase [Candidatus Lokiarchaeota archaeon]|nr:MBL fold metallo-hydrolase [Candidatus Lokiarchaeota archaeon]
MAFSNLFTINSLTDDIYAIQEDISRVNRIYTNDPLNLYLILGDHSALLLDTGCGLAPLKPIVDNLIETRELIVMNSHAHWDHVLGNKEFEEVYIHKNEVKSITQAYDLSSHPEIFRKAYGKRHYIIPPSKKIKAIQDGDIFELGGYTIEILHAPGHSPGSICLLTNKKELFTTDVAYYGDQFLPSRKRHPQVLATLSHLIDVVKKRNVTRLFPSHQQTPCDVTLLTDLYRGIARIPQLWDKKQFNKDFYSWIIKDPHDKRFKYIISAL